MTRARAPRAWLALALAASCAPAAARTTATRATVTVWHVDGADVARDDAADFRLPGSEAIRAELDRRAALSQAARDLSCPAVSLHAEKRGWRERLYVVEGCGRRGVFLGQQQAAGPDAAGVVTLTWAYADLSAPGRDAGDETLRRWRDLVTSGARDLACPADRVVPDFLDDRIEYRWKPYPSFAVVEGCGKRAVYDRHPWPPFCDPTVVPVDPDPAGLPSAREPACPEAAARAERAGTDEDGRVLVATGCGRRATYVRVEWSPEPGAGVVRLVDLDGDLLAQVQGAPPKVTRLVTAYATLRAQGARDLRCPVADVVPALEGTRSHQWPVAEGCGRRAVYLPGLDPPFRARSFDEAGASTGEPGSTACPR